MDINSTLQEIIDELGLKGAQGDPGADGANGSDGPAGEVTNAYLDLTLERYATLPLVQAITDALLIKPDVVPAPPHSNSPGLANTIAFDGNYIYVCYPDNQWKRIALATGW